MIIYDAESLDVVKIIDKAHSKGVIDVKWLDTSDIVTCSTDGTINIFSMEGALQS